MQNKVLFFSAVYNVPCSHLFNFQFHRKISTSWYVISDRKYLFSFCPGDILAGLWYQLSRPQHKFLEVCFHNIWIIQDFTRYCFFILIIIFHFNASVKKPPVEAQIQFDYYYTVKPRISAELGGKGTVENPKKD